MDRTMSTQRPIVSVILATRNRRAVLEHTLNRLDDCGLDRAELETIVVDNDSTDWTPAAIVDRINRLICLPRNCGSTARAYGADVARGRFLVFLDDDAHPSPGTLERMIGRFESQPGLGAAGFQVHRSGSREDDTALPGVFARCGAGLRAEAYSKSGGLDRTFFMQGEECDLCFRLAMAGWDLEIFDDLHVEHQQTTERRPVDQHLYNSSRNHLRVLARYLPSPFAAICRVDCIQRLG